MSNPRWISAGGTGQDSNFANTANWQGGTLPANGQDVDVDGNATTGWDGNHPTATEANAMGGTGGVLSLGSVGLNSPTPSVNLTFNAHLAASTVDTGGIITVAGGSIGTANASYELVLTSGSLNSSGGSSNLSMSGGTFGGGTLQVFDASGGTITGAVTFNNSSGIGGSGLLLASTGSLTMGQGYGGGGAQITGGTFNGPVDISNNYSSSISGGTFTNSVATGSISGGTFGATGAGVNVTATGTVSGGTFTGGTLNISGGYLYDGTYTGVAISGGNQYYSPTISGGTFHNCSISGPIVTGGTFDQGSAPHGSTQLAGGTWSGLTSINEAVSITGGSWTNQTLTWRSSGTISNANADLDMTGLVLKVYANLTISGGYMHQMTGSPTIKPMSKAVQVTSPFGYSGTQTLVLSGVPAGGPGIPPGVL